MNQYDVTGMTCAACSARVEKAVSAVPGVTSCSVNLLTNSMGVEGDVQPEKIIEAVEKAGYKAAEKGAAKAKNAAKDIADDEPLKDRETPKLKRRLIASLCFLLPLMYFSMGHMMWNWPVPQWFEGNHVASGLLQLLLTTAVMIVNQKFFISGFKGLIHRAPNMDTLVALGAGASYGYSLYALFAMTDAQMHGDMAKTMSYMHDFYFESAAMILTLITVGKLLEARSKGKTTDALKGLMRLSPKTAVVIRNGKEEQVDVGQVKKGDIFLVKPGESIPVDGIVLEGYSAVNEAALTGESIPAEKQTGDRVSAATLNGSGFLKCEAVRVGEDTTLSQIIRMVSDAAATKAPVAKAADRVSGIFVPIVMAIACVTFLVWLFAGETAGFALARAISVLVISCPCALGLATPVAIMVGNGLGAKKGILFKTAVSLEQTGKIQIAVLDKTGTITKGEPCVTDIIPCEGMTETELLRQAYILEKKSEHPLAAAVIRKAEEEKIISEEETKDFEIFPGMGLFGRINGDELTGGNLDFISGKSAVSEDMKVKAKNLATEGKTPLFFAKNGVLSGMIAVSDTIKDDSPEAIGELKKMGIHVVMLTGDNEYAAQAVGRLAGVDEVIAGVLPDGKEQVIRSMKEKGRVVMVGDGINDAPALTRADIGMAIGAGTDVAVDAADVVLMKNTLRDVPAAIRLSRETLRNIHENLFWAFFYNVVGIPLAAGVWIPIFGLQLNPMFAAAAMSLSSFCVVTNALRLNWCDPYRSRKTKKIKQKQKEDTMMKKTLKIEGMMCGHCEARVKKALEALPEVTEALVSHETGEAVVTLSSEVSDEVLKKTVEDQDYKVTAVL